MRGHAGVVGVRECRNILPRFCTLPEANSELTRKEAFLRIYTEGHDEVRKCYEFLMEEADDTHLCIVV